MYCTVDEVRGLARRKLTAEEISDEEIVNCIHLAQIHMTQDLFIQVDNERVQYIDNERKNIIDGTNKTFYTRLRPIADGNQDGLVNPTDIEVYAISSEGERTKLEVSSVNPKYGYFELSEAPSSQGLQEIVVDYWSRPTYLTDNDLKLACIYLTLSLCFLGCDSVLIKHLDQVDILRQPDLSREFRKMYETHIMSLQASLGSVAEDDPQLSIPGTRRHLPQKW
jgi:hypothetical protein